MLKSIAGTGLSELRGRPGQFPTCRGILVFAKDRESICEDDRIGLGSE